MFSHTYGAGSDGGKLHNVEDYVHLEVINVYTTSDADFEEKEHNNWEIWIHGSIILKWDSSRVYV
jgi:hypothetical protein